MKFCKDCKHFAESAGEAICKHPVFTTRELIYGEPIYVRCTDVRQAGTNCGIQAKLFEPHNYPPVIKPILKPTHFSYEQIEGAVRLMKENEDSTNVRPAP